MILTVPPAKVTAVLLDDGGWRDVAHQSFSIGSGWEVRDADVIVRHTADCGAECRAGFAFATPDGVIVAGPLDRLREVR